MVIVNVIIILLYAKLEKFKDSGNAQSTNLVNNKNFVLLQTAEVILFKDFNQKEVRIKALFDGESQRCCVSKRVQNILSPINKQKIKINTFNNNNSEEEISDYVKLSVKTETGNNLAKHFAFYNSRTIAREENCPQP